MGDWRKRHDKGFVTIGIFKLVKALLLFAVGIGTLPLLNDHVNQAVNHWAHVLQVGRQNRFLQEFLVRSGVLDRHNIELLSVTTFAFTALLLAEGIGLLLEKVWAEYLTTVITASFIPLELYELTKRGTPLRIVFLAINLAVVSYLVLRLKQRHAARKLGGTPEQ